jgi:two-component system phosphate regulon sensor histidine kinase PhoR
VTGDPPRRRLFGRASAAETAPASAAREPLGPVLDAIGDPLLIVDGWTVIHANAAARSLLGAVAADDDIRLSLRHPAAAGVVHGREDGPVLLSGLGGIDRHWELMATPIAGSRRLLRFLDRSGQRAAERMRVDFVANASHELRTPLATLIGFIETLEEANGPADAAVRRRFLAIMDGEARRMQRLIDDLMSLSRIEADRYSAPRMRADLVTLSRIAVAELRTGAGGDRIDLTVKPPVAEVLGDPGQISQLIHNIAGNALKYARPGTPVRVTLSRHEDWFCLAVEDEGDGIAPEHIPRLTERFYRVDPSRSRAVGGTGLGLAITKHIVERHRGRLDIQSEVGRGTTVTVWLPPAAALS